MSFFASVSLVKCGHVHISRMSNNTTNESFCLNIWMLSPCLHCLCIASDTEMTASLRNQWTGCWLLLSPPLTREDRGCVPF